MRIKRGRGVVCAVCGGRRNWAGGKTTVISYSLIDNLRSGMDPKLTLLTVVLRPPWETLGKANKFGSCVKLRGAGISFAKEDLLLQQASIFIPFLQLEGCKSVSFLRGYVLDTHRLQNQHSVSVGRDPQSLGACFANEG